MWDYVKLDTEDGSGVAIVMVTAIKALSVRPEFSGGKVTGWRLEVCGGNGKVLGRMNFTRREAAMTALEGLAEAAAKSSGPGSV